MRRPPTGPNNQRPFVLPNRRLIVNPGNDKGAYG